MPRQFNNGDRITVIIQPTETGYQGYYNLGNSGTVLDYSGGNYYVQFDLPHPAEGRDDDGMWWVKDTHVGPEKSPNDTED